MVKESLTVKSNLSMNSKVKVEANKARQLISVSPNNPQWGWIRVTQNRNVLDVESGIIRSTFCSALVLGTINDLEKLNWTDGQELEGIIIFKDSMTPFNKKDPEKDLKVAGKSGIVLTHDGQPIYRKYMYSPNLNAQDVYIPHDEECHNDIVAAYLDQSNQEVMGVLNVEEPSFSL